MIEADFYPKKAIAEGAPANGQAEAILRLLQGNPELSMRLMQLLLCNAVKATPSESFGVLAEP